jgi:hypothetical protein
VVFSFLGFLGGNGKPSAGLDYTPPDSGAPSGGGGGGGGGPGGGGAIEALDKG